MSEAHREANDFRRVRSVFGRDESGRFISQAIEPVEDRFWAKVEKTESCWLWMARPDRYGYGKFYVAEGSPMLAHRYAYESLIGPISEGLTLDHLCRNRACVNPAHLEPVTLAENKRRGAGKSGVLFQRTTHCKQGHRFDAANTRIGVSGRRTCRACHREWSRAYRRRKHGG